MKKNVYICITESLCCTAEINLHNIVSQLCLNKKNNKLFGQAQDLRDSQELGQG